jgi:cellulose synthase/poly-beta-1,6-N-acetylglucosamine synthase-like glycosyltransferase
LQDGVHEPSVPALNRLKETNIDIRDVTHALARYAPEDSSHQPMPPRLVVAITLIISLVIGAIINGNSLPLILLTLMLTSYFPLYVMAILLDVRTPLTLEFLADTQLPQYTVILPLYKEANMVGQITYAMRQINYPSKKIEFFYVVEESDLQTYKALRKALSEALAEGIVNEKILVVPDGTPRTKPRACNYALAHASGDLLVIYDAEDIPHRDQLRAAASEFARHENINNKKLACLQAPLDIKLEKKEGFWARQMTLDYLHLFRFILPALVRFKIPLPLGGSSNHFKVNVLREIYGWDSWNVTEDADIGIRMAFRGYTTAMIAPPTIESPTRDFWDFVKQRTRWQKGHFQTLLVLLRKPLKLIKKVGVLGYMGLHLVILTRCLYGLGAWVFIVVCLFSIPDIQSFADYQWQLFVILINWAMIFYSYFYVCHRAKRSDLFKDIFGLFVIWLLAGFITCRAIAQLFWSPFTWEKTNHTPIGSSMD